MKAEEGVIACPICNETLMPPKNSNFELFLSRHVDRCSTRRRSRKRVSYVEEEIDEAALSDGEVVEETSAPSSSTSSKYPASVKVEPSVIVKVEPSVIVKVEGSKTSDEPTAYSNGIEDSGDYDLLDFGGNEFEDDDDNDSDPFDVFDPEEFEYNDSESDSVDDEVWDANEPLQKKQRSGERGLGKRSRAGRSDTQDKGSASRSRSRDAARKRPKTSPVTIKEETGGIRHDGVVKTENDMIMDLQAVDPLNEFEDLTGKEGRGKKKIKDKLLTSSRLFTEYVADDWEENDYIRRLKKLRGGPYDISASPAGVTEAAQASSTLEATEYGTKVFKESWKTLYDYQKEGCRWMHSLYQDGVGGILGDEMGLGKTCQLCTHFGSLGRTIYGDRGTSSSSSRGAARASPSAIFLIVCPATVLQHWLKELRRWEPRMRTVILHSISSTGGEIHKLGNQGVELVLRQMQRAACTEALTVLITYEGMRRYQQSLCMIEWTAVCLDEGQKIRNHMAEVTKVCKLLPCYHRMILSGTPIQNNLQELWSLFDFIYPGRLGSLPVFEVEFCDPIRIGGYAGASRLHAEVAVRTAAALQRIVKKYLLRRRKDDLRLVAMLPQKREQVLFCKLSPLQRRIYEEILDSPEVEAVIAKRCSAFRAITTLRKLCNHPVFAYRNGRVCWHESIKGKNHISEDLSDIEDVPELAIDDGGNGGLDSGIGPDMINTKAAGSTQPNNSKSKGGKFTSLKKAGNSFSRVDDEDDDTDSANLSWEESGKLRVLSKILPLWQAEGHKVLLFSQTQNMLNLIEALLQKFINCKYLRLDGSTTVKKRQGLIERFNADASVFMMLLTTRTGGVGISLTGANRVILLDPDWNPQTDMQARERAWRLGQTREVTIYRLISKGTIEEKMYQRQIFKVLLSNRILEDPKQKALFSKSEIKDLFTLNDNEGIGLDGSYMPSLPKEGNVDMKNQEETASSASNASATTGETQSVASSASAPGQNASNDAMRDPSKEWQLMDDGANNRDKKLLQALFDGEALSHVYDHNYLEKALSNSLEERIAREAAQRRVDEAVRALERSAPTFLASDNPPDDGSNGNGQVESSTSGHQQRVVTANSLRARNRATASTSQTTAPSNVNSSNMRDGQTSNSSADGAAGGTGRGLGVGSGSRFGSTQGNMGVKSSSSVLANLRAQKSNPAMVNTLGTAPQTSALNVSRGSQASSSYATAEGRSKSKKVENKDQEPTATSEQGALNQEPNTENDMDADFKDMIRSSEAMYGPSQAEKILEDLVETSKQPVKPTTSRLRVPSGSAAMSVASSSRGKSSKPKAKPTAGWASSSILSRSVYESSAPAMHTKVTPSQLTKHPASKLRETINARLSKLFQNKKRRLSTDAVLQSFTDLGDQYAVIFKEELKAVAKMDGGQWIAR